MVKQACKFYILQCLLCALYWLIKYSRKLLKGFIEHSDETFYQALLSSLIDLLSQLKQLPAPISE
ncbi:hypothetical protein [Candidatus Chlamydia sanziniae]|uniref:Uncharacterized protein n=1 Tax=Candidatus Chlamydia sanziniae TaxID=1806891 RepID=A0A1A9HWH0_9CHLA|nr:hypothetical protein [Candidatus Chlamydia sanziniae]ANH78276.1 hypothetical protein Cs308_0105 [Candidatus Chlamydia sanziniae]